MPICTFLFSRHCGSGTYSSPPTPFLAGKLDPMIEKARIEGKTLHLIHDMIPTLGLPIEIIREFDKLESNRKFRRDVFQTERRWRLSAKTRLERANNGEGTSDDLQFPEGRLILEANRAMPRSIMNHLGFFTSEVVIEFACAKSHSLLAMELASEGKMKEAIDHMVKSIDALASAALLRDTELVKQLVMIGQDTIVLRNLHHVYLSEMRNYDILVTANGKPMQMHELYSGNSIEVEDEIDEVDLTFSEAAANRICLGATADVSQRRDALLDIIFIGIMRKNDLWKKEGGIEDGLRKTIDLYEELVREQAQEGAEMPGTG